MKKELMAKPKKSEESAEFIFPDGNRMLIDRESAELFAPFVGATVSFFKATLPEKRRKSRNK